MYALSNKIVFNFCHAEATLSNGFLQQTYYQNSRETLKLEDYNQTLQHIFETAPVYTVFCFLGKHYQQVSQCAFSTGFVPVQQNLRIKI